MYQILQGHLEEFLERVRDPLTGRNLPAYVERELRHYLECGILAHGFARVRCDTCADELLVAFSCKRRICPSCGGRRMAQVAAHLVDDVLPHVPVRQWVLTLPIRVRYRIAHRPAWITAVLRVFINVLAEHLRRKTGRPDGQIGTVTFIQRFGGSMNLNPHLHSLALDGVYTCDDSPAPVFHPAPPPTDQEIGDLTAELARRIKAALIRAGAFGEDELDDLAEDEPVLARISGASVQGRLAFGERSGRPVSRVGAVDPRFLPPRAARGVDGYTLHASRPVPAHDRDGLERLIRYAARPAVCESRLEITPDDQVVLTLKQDWDDGTTHITFKPLELVEKLAALVAPPGANLIRYHGVLAPGSALRRWIVPASPTPPPCPTRPEAADAPARASRWIPWADLLRRVFAIDLLECPACGGRRRVIAFITEHDVIEAILSHLDLPTRPPRIVPAAEQLVFEL